MEYSAKNHPEACFITLRGPFTFGDNAAFDTLLSRIEKQNVPAVVFDFSEVGFIDYAALGMLLLLREETRRPERIVLRGAQGQVRKMFDLSKFADLFVVEQ